MGLLNYVVENHEQELREIIKNMDKNNYDFMMTGVEEPHSPHDVVKRNIDGWISSRIKGVSVTLAFYHEEPAIIKLIDMSATEYFKKSG